MGTKITQLIGQATDHLRERAGIVRGLLKERALIDKSLAKLGHAESSRKERRKTGRTCGKCGKTGHNARTCK